MIYRFINDPQYKWPHPSEQNVVFTNGCFDLFHVGHLDSLNACKIVAGKDGIVVVGMNSDKSVKRLKGNSRPIIDENSRANIVASIKGVDFVYIFDEDTPDELIKTIRPNVIVKGIEYAGQDIVGKDIAPVFLHEMESRWSTSNIIHKIKKEC